MTEPRYMTLEEWDRLCDTWAKIDAKPKRKPLTDDQLDRLMMEDWEKEQRPL